MRKERINGSVAVRRHNVRHKRKKPAYSIQRILRGFDDRTQKAPELVLQHGVDATTSASLCSLTGES